jgi:hypothetical protein
MFVSKIALIALTWCVAACKLINRPGLGYLSLITPLIPESPGNYTSVFSKHVDIRLTLPLIGLFDQTILIQIG